MGGDVYDMRVFFEHKMKNCIYMAHSNLFMAKVSEM